MEGASPALEADLSREKRRRIPITNHQRRLLRQYARQHPSKTQIEYRHWFERQYGRHLTQGQVSEILSQRYDDVDDVSASGSRERRRTMPAAVPELEKALFEWQQRLQAKEVIITGDMLQATAHRLWPSFTQYHDRPEPHWSQGWLGNFKNRYNIRQFVRHGEASSVNPADALGRIKELQELLKRYNAEDQYNVDETGLFWKAIPNRTLATERQRGRKQSKERISIIVACNATGSDKLPLWVIGKAQRPRAFDAARVNIATLDCRWRSNKKAWNTTIIHEEWLRWLNHRLDRQNR